MITLPHKQKKPPFLSLGLDLSVNATGVILLEATPTGPKALLEEEIKIAGEGLKRKRLIAARVMEIVHARKPDRIVIEGYSLAAKNMSSVIPLVELGALVRLSFQLDGIGWLDPNASQVKKFATGKGNSPKDVVMMHVLKRWGHESKTNNTADAFVCAAIGLAHANRLGGTTVEQRAIAGAVKFNVN